MPEPRDAAKPARKRTTTPKAAARPKRTTARKPAPPPEAPAPVETPAARPRGRRRTLAAVAAALVLAGSAAGAAVYVVSDRGTPVDVRTGTPVLVSAGELADYAETAEASVYWAGETAGGRLELTATSTGTFVRYLPAGAAAGDPRPALTIATYPLQDAFATATARAEDEQMTAEDVRGGGIAVWARAQPSSVYVAFPGVPELVEVYSPDAGESRSLAVSGRVVAVR